ncbi:MaoC/PaaZ C-terminal domain-containing protein [Haloarchaeobius iranensis]|uniref:Acyl dehydratase n=1 Tax=Haloarchaeobius iranensis TaxID=996166 RepID=A0A1G9XD38_9EURY|nr:MaoC/PaaZ C-terminal domain-containing protein [Haloarchaeobius iranensis]SDM94617.1 Acyl dehydratase [Haloarchaeobius iranensis]
MRYFEDLEAGESHDLGTVSLSADEIREFGEQYDPMPMHVDPEVTEPFGGLVASGYHTLAAVNRVVVDEFRSGVAGIAGMSIENHRWHAPVYPDEELTVTLELAERRPSAGRPGTGIVRECVTVTRDGDDGPEPVLTYDSVGLVRRRED